MALTKAEMEAFKKKNFDKSKKVTEAQLDKLRKEGTPTKAIAKYKNDPSMLEALNRFYGKDRVKKAGGGSTSSTGTSSSTGSVRGGPGAKMPKRPSGGPGAKMTARDGRGASSLSKTTSKGTTRQTTKVVSGTNAYANQAAQRRKSLENMTPAQRKRADQAVAFGKNVLLPASLTILPVGKIPIVAKGATAAATKISPMITRAASKVAKSKTAAKATNTAAKVGNKVSTKSKAAEQAAIRKALAAKKNLTKSKTGKHSAKSGKHSAKSNSNEIKVPSGIKPLPEPYMPNLTNYPKLDEAKLRRIMGK